MVTAHPAIMQQGYSRTLLPVQLYLRARTVLHVVLYTSSSGRPHRIAAARSSPPPRRRARGGGSASIL
jgi:hypothetical protein